MRAFYGSRISENMSTTPEGYLICLNVPIARTGSQTYLRSELGYLDDDPNGMVKVYRTEDEVFSRATLASFEGKPVTDDHPAVGVDATNISAFDNGHAQNIRRGTGADSDLLIADLFITSPRLIDAIKGGRREVSCGYDCDYVERDGKLYQCSIRGNHIAVVSAGRAGPRVAIKDSAVEQRTKTYERGMKMAKSKHSLFANIFSRAVKDMEPEEVADAIEELANAGEEEEVVEPGRTDAEPGIAELAAALTALTAKVDALCAKDCKDAEEAPAPNPFFEKKDEDPLEKLEDEIVGGENQELPAPTDEEEVAVPPEQIDEEIPETITDEAGLIAPESEKPDNPIKGADSMGALRAIKAVKPVIAKLPKAQRKAASDRAVAEIRKLYGLDAKPATNGYANITAVIRQTAKGKTADSKAKVDNGEIGRNIMKKRNPHYKD